MGSGLWELEFRIWRGVKQKVEFQKSGPRSLAAAVGGLPRGPPPRAPRAEKNGFFGLFFGIFLLKTALFLTKLSPNLKTLVKIDKNRDYFGQFIYV